MKKAYVLLFDGYSDWEIGYVLPPLRRMGNLEVVGVGFHKKSVVSVGGLEVTPHVQLSDVRANDAAIFILPGGQMWENDYPREALESILQALEAEEVPIAAICAGTTALARAGMLEGRKHTSNALSYLKDHVPEYNGDDRYEDSLATAGSRVVTASGLGSVEFAYEVLMLLELASPEMLQNWFRAFKYGEYSDNF